MTESVDVAALVNKLKAVEDALNRVILGKPELIRQFMTGILARGHLLLEGLPGLGKTQMVRAFSSLCHMSARRIQFTPDLMPLDITGSYMIREQDGSRDFEFHEGPVFGNLILADEINRASPKTQSALLEAMAEHRVTVLGNSHALPDPFIVMATQNPIEMEGTYPLPEAQLDRFLFKLSVMDVDENALAEILMERGRGDLPALQPILSLEEIRQAMQVIESMPLSQPVAQYIARLVKATHAGDHNKIEAARHIRHGASPRAGLAMAMASRARAFLNGRQTVGFEDVKDVALATLRHRIILDYTAKLDGQTADGVVSAILKDVPELSRAAPESLAEQLA